MNYQAMVGVLREAGVEVRDQPVLPSALGLPDGARTRLLVDHEGLFRVYYAEHLPSTLPMTKIKGALKMAGDEALLLLDRGGERFVALHTTAEGEGTQAELDEGEVVRLLPNVLAVGGKDPYAVSERVKDLILRPEEKREAYQNKGLFSDDYLKHRLTEPGQYPEWREGVSRAREKLRELYGSKREYLDGLNEAQTENEFLDEALEVLGHAFVKQTRTKDGSRPDYALFGDVGAKDAALRVQANPTKLYATSLAVAEGKYWGRNLDVYTKKDDKDNEATASQKSSPEMQIARYLQETGLSWGILTNGSEWRLYHGGAPGMTKRYYSVDLVRALESEDLEDFRRFYLFFRRDAFVPKGAEGKSFLDRVHTGSEEYAVRVGNNLKKVVFERLFAQLATGFLEYHGREMDQPVDEEVLKKTYRGTLALLYRLLFLLYAEARDLLPHRDRLGYGVHSITRLKRDVAARLGEGEKFSDKSYVIWERLESLFRIVDEGSRELNVPPYNGGLFQDAGSHEFLGTHRVSDWHLAPALDELSRQEVEGGERRFVDYGFIGVRELGSVYEGLLEFSLRIADEDLVVVKEKNKEVYVPKGSQKKKKDLGSVKKGEPYLVNDKKERKATGAYYTPRYIVDYIVRNTLGPLVEERREALETRLAEVAREDLSLKRGRKSEEYRAERRREAGALRTLLDVKVLDPAMGSGHFLVAAVDYLTDEFSRIISELDAEPVVEELAELRAEIRASLEAYGASATDEQLSDANLLKRMVLKRCVYGVDLNEMAVELAKLSLWLDAFTVGAPLSFLDHHLKHGHSLIGSSVREVRRELEGSGALSGTAFEGLLSGAETMHELEEIPDATITQVRDSASLYAVADKILDPMKRVMDVWTSKHFDNAFAETVLKDELSAKNFPELKRGDLSSFSDRGRKVFETAADLRETKDFFHWELEFPEVFYEGARERENAGFDAVVGNPPYVRGRVLLSQDKSFYATRYWTTHKSYDLYVLFVELGLRLLRNSGFWAMIIPRSFLTESYGEKIRRFALENTNIMSIADYLGVRVFEDVSVINCVPTLERITEHPRNNQIRILRIAESTEYPIDQRVFLQTPQSTYRVELTPETLGVVTRLSSNSLSLGSICYVSYSVAAHSEVEGKGKEAYLYASAVNHKCKPFIEGKEIDRYQITWQGRYLEYDPQILRRPSLPELLESPKITVVGISSSSGISAAYDEGFFYVGYPAICLTLKHYLQSVKRSGIKFSSVEIDRSKQLDLGYIIALLNSRLFKYYFDVMVFSTSQTIYSDNLRELPIREIKSLTTNTERKVKLDRNVALYAGNDYDVLLSQTIEQAQMQPEQSAVIHDLLAYLAKQMTEMNKSMVAIRKRWQEWVEAAIPNQHKLTKEFRERGWIEIGLERSWEGVKAEFQARNAIPSGKALQDLRRETEEALEELRPLYERIQSTDELIDQIVYRLYGLTEDEISVVEASVERG